MSNWLQEKSWAEAAEAITKSKGTVIIPVGSVEQHGYHLPVGTDSYAAISLAEDAAAKTDSLIAPPIWYGWSPHHMVLPGTVTIRPEVLSELLYDVIESLTKHGANKFIVINGHRIVNIAWMTIAAQKAQTNLGVIVKLFDPAYMSKDIIKKLGWNTVGHAEEIETSQMMHIHPDMVHIEKAKDNPIVTQLRSSVDPAYTGDTVCYVPSTVEQAQKNAEIAGGAVGEPTKSNAACGRIYHEHLLHNLVSVINSLN